MLCGVESTDLLRCFGGGSANQPSAPIDDMATEATLLHEAIGVAKNNIIERIVAHCYRDGVVNVPQLKRELAHYKPPDLVSRSGLARDFALLMRKVEQHVVMHLAAQLDEEDADLNALGAKITEMNVEEPLQGSAPMVHVEVVPKSTTAKDGKQVLSSFDQLKEATQLKLVLRVDKEGRMVNANGNLVWVHGSNDHYVCVGRKDGPHTRLLASEDVMWLKTNRLAYDASKVAVVAKQEEIEE